MACDSDKNTERSQLEKNWMMLQSRLGASYRLFFMNSTQPANNSLKRTAGAGSSLPSVSTDVLLKLAVITGNEDYRLKAATPCGLCAR